MTFFTATSASTACATKAVYLPIHETRLPPALLFPDLVDGWIASKHAGTVGQHPSIGCHMFENATLIHNGYVMTAGRQLVSDLDLTHAWNQGRAEKLLADPEQSRHPLYRAVLAGGEGLEQISLDDTVEYISLIRPGYTVYGHWLLDILPAAWLYFKMHDHQPVRPRRFIIAKRTPAWAREMLKRLFDLCDEDFVEYDDLTQMLTVRHLVVSSFLRASPLVSPLMNEFIADVQFRLGAAQPDGELPRRFMISRANYRNLGGRLLLNSEAVEDCARAHGLALLAPETLPWPRQVALFTQAELVVGETGSGLHNTLFSLPDTLVIALGNAQMSWTQSAIAATRGQHMQYIMPATQGQTAANGISFEVDVVQLHTALERVTARFVGATTSE